MEAIDLNKFSKDHKLLIKPNIFMSFIKNFDGICNDMNHKKVVPIPYDNSDCSFCCKMRELKHDESVLCKKHKSISEWTKFCSRSGRGIFKDNVIHMFNQYVLVETPNDYQKIFVVWIDCNDMSDFRYNVFCLERGMFKDIDTIGKDISILLDKNVVTFNDQWQCYFNADKNEYVIEDIFTKENENGN